MTYTARDAWSVRGGWHDEQAERRWWYLRLEQRETGETREAMRARRLGTTVDELRARRAERLAEFAADAQAAGLIPADVTTDTTVRLPALPDDDRLPWEVCAMCIRTLHRRKGRRVEVRPGGVFVCRCCASLRQDGPPEVLDQWLLDSRPYKRAAIIATYSVDPARLVAAGVRAEVTRLHTDVDGLPLSVETTPAMAAAHMVPVSTFFGLVRARGHGILLEPSGLLSGGIGSAGSRTGNR